MISSYLLDFEASLDRRTPFNPIRLAVSEYTDQYDFNDIGLAMRLPPGSRIVVDIPFTRPQQLGKFVYHCHILGHEDKGMMATIEVVR